MKYILVLLISIATVSSVHATDFPVDSPSKVPTGYKINGDGWYTSSTSSDRYQVSNTYNGGNGGYAIDTTDTNNILGISAGELRSGNVNMNTIPTVLVNIIKVIIGLAGTISIVALIYHAVQMQLKSGITGDSSGVDHAKKGMIAALIGFLLSISAWFIVAKFVALLVSVS